ncbi:MAG: hypothetical protein AB7E47_12645 [Desulfovibrionaceae bacterium]
MKKVKAQAGATSLPGAAESNAGDDFHVLWACRKCLALLDRRSELSAVFVEDVSAFDMKNTKADAYLMADVSEYYGLKDGRAPEWCGLAHATRVVVSQLKYSTRHPERSWTIARLTTISGKEKQRSVLSRFVDTLKAYLGKNARNEVLAKLQLCLVSNQPLDSALLQAVNEAQHVLHKLFGSQNIQLRVLLRELTEPTKRLINEFYKKTQGVSSTAFVDLLRVIDLTMCGQENRWNQRNAVLSKIGDLVSEHLDSYYLKLRAHIDSRMLPHSGIPTPITRENLLVALGVVGEESLFPSPPLFETTENYIPTGEPKRLADTIFGLPHGKILVRGEAGVGKTAVVQRLADHLPPGSEVFFYDCYGGGRYRETCDERHSPIRAVIQIVNELAVRLGLPLCINLGAHLPDQMRWLEKSLSNASELVANQKGLLILVIDAADNSVFAGKDCGNGSFVKHIWGLKLHHDCRLVVTARHGERSSSDYLGYREAPLLFDVKAFDTGQSLIHLRTRFPDAIEDAGLRFHRKTNGNPRLQKYTLDDRKPEESLDDLLNRTHETLQAVFADIWQRAIEPLPATQRENFAFLSCLLPPIPVSTFAALSGSETDAIRHSCRGFEPGLILTSKDTLRFLDEDFETFVHDRLNATERASAHADIGKRMTGLASEDAYAATHLARHYEKGNCPNELIELALSGDAPQAIQDETARHAVVFDRLRRAFTVADRHDRKADVLKLMVLSAEAAQSKAGLDEIIGDRLDFAMRYGDPQTVAQGFLKQGNEELGELHFRIAARLARLEGKQKEAWTHLRMGEAWLHDVSAKYGSRFHIKRESVAHAAEAIFLLAGPARALRWLSRFRNFSFVARCCWLLASALALDIKPTEQERLWARLPLDPRVAALFLVAFWKAGNVPSSDLVEAVAQDVARFLDEGNKWCLCRQNPISRDTDDPFEWAHTIDFYELLARHGHSDLAVRFLEQMPFDLPDSPAWRGWGVRRIAPELRGIALHGVLTKTDINSEALLPEIYHSEKLTPELERRKGEYLSLLKDGLGILQCRACCLLNKPAIGDVWEDMKRLVATVRQHNHQDMDRGGWPVKRTWALEAVLYCQGDEKWLVERYIGLGVDTPAQHLLNAAALLITDARYRETALDCLEQARSTTWKELNEGSERRTFFLECAAVAHPYETDLARELFQDAVKAAGSIGRDSCYILDFHVTLAQRCTGIIEASERASVANRLLMLPQAFNPFVYDTNLYETESVATATQLHPIATAAGLMDWDARDFMRLDRSMPVYLEACLASGAVEPETTTALARLGGETCPPHFLLKQVLEQLKQADDSQNRLKTWGSVMVDWINLDCPISSKPSIAKSFLELNETSAAMSQEQTTALRNICDFAASLPNTGRTPAAEYTEDRNKEPKEENRWQTRLQNPPGKLHESLDWVYETLLPLRSDVGWADVFTFIREGVTRQARVKYLKQLIAMPFDRYDAGALWREVMECFHIWQHSEAVQKWRPEGIRLLVRKYLPRMLGYYYQREEENWDSLESIEDPAVRWEILIQAIAENMEGLSAWQCFSLAKHLVVHVTAEDQLATLRWSLERTITRLKDENAPLAEYDTQALGEATLSGFILSLLGHPDSHVRWRTMHALRLLEISFGQNWVGPLLKLDQEGGRPPFIPKDVDFFALSARCALLTLCARLAELSPERMRGHMDTFVAYARDKALPHALVRHLAAKVALKVAETYPEDLSPEVRAALEWAYEPRYDRIDSVPKLQVGRHCRQQRRIQFDWDTTGYWFNHVAEAFGIRTDDVCLRAERWIDHSLGGIDKRRIWDSKKPYGRYEYPAKSHEHGSLPRVESQDLYGDFHSMFLVAGELADKQRNNDADSNEDWRDWMNYKAQPAGSWTSERRQPVPLDKQLWQDIPDDEPWLSPLDQEFETVIGVHPNAEPDELVVQRTFYRHQWGRNESVTVSSALVFPETSEALLRACQSVDNPYEYGFPSDGDEFDRFGVDYKEFRLEGFIRYSYGECRGMEQNDPQRRTLQPHDVMPSKAFQHHHGITSNELKTEWRDASGHLVVHREVWDETKEDHHGYQVNLTSEGSRLWIRLDSLLGYLEAEGKSLILKVKIDRRKERHGSESETPLPKHRVYLIHADGTLVSMGERRSIGPVNPSRA